MEIISHFLASSGQYLSTLVSSFDQALQTNGGLVFYFPLFFFFLPRTFSTATIVADLSKGNKERKGKKKKRKLARK
jgi:hypothetical protein